MPERDAADPGSAAALPKRHGESAAKTFLVAFVMALAAGLIVAGSSLRLRPIQAANQDIDTQRNVLEVAGIESVDGVRRTFLRQVRVRMVDLETGEYTSAADPVQFDPQAAARDPETSRNIPKEADIAGLGRREDYARAYLVQEDGDLKAVVLPVRGRAYSEMSALLALASDGNTIIGFKAYEHEETPGLGGRVDDPAWRARWEGKALRDELGRLRLELSSEPAGPDSLYRVDAITGATITSQGVQNIVRFWMGEYGFGPFLSRLRQGDEP
ncbi:MAG: Na(+)-translocating NADH-quinone reductase subunit C [Gemmatimonadales bacterium]|jgi:Na+-transporting NADH:ubiquinone oxidoreductase subunit C